MDIGNSLAKLRSLKAEPGFERALAAALGEDADAALGKGDAGRRWEGSEPQAADPALPAGAPCLADHAEAPAQLRRRLRQVAIVDEDTGQPLAVGQRLVTRDGLLCTIYLDEIRGTWHLERIFD